MSRSASALESLPTPKNGHGLRAQLIIALVLPAVVVLAGATFLAEIAVTGALDQSLGERLIAVASAGAALSNERLLLLEPGDDESRTAERSRARLSELARQTGAEQVMLVTLGDDSRVVLDSKRQYAIGDEYVRAEFDRLELTKVKEGVRSASVLFQGPEGRWYKTGYAPLQDAEGNAVAAVVVNAPAAFFAAIRDLRQTLIGIAVFAFITLLALAFVAARGVTVPLSRLSQAATRIGRGELDTEVPTGGPREARVLSATMRNMASSLGARERELQLMLAGIAHEVRNPLGGIELFGGLLKEDLEVDDPRRKHVDKILKEIGVLACVVNDFLEYARRRPLEPERADVTALLDEVRALAASSASNVQFDLDCPPGLHALLDVESMQRALLNLAQNGAQAVSEKGGRVRLGARTEGSDVLLEVEDDGPGIPEENRALVFTPFFTTKQKGTGLGLALVQKCAESHGGAVSVEASPKGGALFLIRLPDALAPR